mgnify:CR=1 FL=1
MRLSLKVREDAGMVFVTGVVLDRQIVIEFGQSEYVDSWRPLVIQRVEDAFASTGLMGVRASIPARKETPMQGFDVDVDVRLH